MRSAGIREVKNRLSEFLRWVRQGETVLITDRNRVIAQITPPPAYLGTPFENDEEALARLASAGRLRLAQGEMASPRGEPLPKPATPCDLGAALDLSRSERWPG